MGKWENGKWKMRKCQNVLERCVCVSLSLFVSLVALVVFCVACVASLLLLCSSLLRLSCLVATPPFLLPSSLSVPVPCSFSSLPGLLDRAFAARLLVGSPALVGLSWSHPHGKTCLVSSRVASSAFLQVQAAARPAGLPEAYLGIPA